VRLANREPRGVELAPQPDSERVRGTHDENREVGGTRQACLTVRHT
jgi:hypothetical protein